MLKKILIAVYGFIQGYFGVWWNLLGIAFITTAGSVNSKDWQEDSMFIPVGYIMIVVWLVVIIASVCKFKHEGFNVVLFLALLIIGAIFCMSIMFNS